MADIGQLETALRNADAAGDTEAAKTLAAEIMKMRTPAYTGSVLPFSRDAKGNVSFDTNAGILGGLKRAFLLPGQVAQEASNSKNTVSDSDVSVMSVPAVMDLASMATPVNPGVRAGDRAIPGVAGAALEKVPPKVPSTEMLAKAGAQDINAARSSGLQVTASSVGDLSRNIQQSLFDSGIHPTLAKDTHQILKELENAPPGATATAANLQTLREQLQAVAQNFNPASAKDQLAAARAIKQLDEFLPSISPKNVMAGASTSAPATREQLVQRALEGKREAERVSELFQRGRGNWAAAQRSNDLTGVLDRANTGLIERAENRAAANNSGWNLDNTLRTKVASLLEKPKEVSGFSDQEINALNDFVKGGVGRNTAREVGSRLAGGGGVAFTLLTGAGATAGAAIAGVPGAAIGAAIPLGAGATAKSIANSLAKGELRGVDEMTRMRSPLYQEALNGAESIPTHLSKKAAIAKMLLMEAMSQRQQ